MLRHEMTHAASTYGKQAVIDFFDKTVRNGLPMESASQEVFKASWSSVQSGIIKGIRAF
jgi:hypothetical protein